MAIPLVDLSDAELEAFLEEFIQQEINSSYKVEATQASGLRSTCPAGQDLWDEAFSNTNLGSQSDLPGADE